MADAQLNRIEAVAEGFNGLPHETRDRVEAAAVETASLAGTDHYREVLRRLEIMHSLLREEV